MRKSREKLSREVLEHYGARCANPYGLHARPLTIVELLTVDGGGLRLYQQLRLAGYPAGHKVLCLNCAELKRIGGLSRKLGGGFGSSLRVTRGR
jgi:hypothetical protein